MHNALPRQYNAATQFIDQHIIDGRGSKVAYIDGSGTYTYADLSARVNRLGNLLLNLGLAPESRVAMIMEDSIEFPSVFWGALKAGLIPVPINTLLTVDNYRYILHDCRAQVLLLSASLADVVKPALDDQPYLKTVLIVGETLYDDLWQQASDKLQAADSSSDDVAFWLYSSGSTGNPKGVKHLQSSLAVTADCYGRDVLGISEEDVVFSAAKLFFAYGLGNGMTFPLSVGATTVLSAGRPTPSLVVDILTQHDVSLYFGVPTLYAAILAERAALDRAVPNRLRLCVSAGEALPEHTGRHWRDHFKVDIIDGVGSTEMLHIFLSNTPTDLQYGSSGKPVPGYEARLVGDDGELVKHGEIGELVIRGDSAAEGYWNQRSKSQSTFVGQWTYTGDKYYIDEEGRYRFCGRGDDMFKSGGNWVSPFDVEQVLITHEAVLEAAVVAHADRHGNLKPKAFVVLHTGRERSEALAEELKDHVKQHAERWKYPRWISFCDDLPKTATGKIQRYKLRKID